MVGCHVALEGEISATQIKWLSGIKSKDMSGCGRFTLAEDLSSIADITRVDINGYAGSLEPLQNLNQLTELNICECSELTGAFR